MEIPELIEGGFFVDERGELEYVNDFDLSSIKRMYIIRHPEKKIIRAWQGHRVEHKYFKCIKGSFVVAWKKVDDFSKPDDQNKVEFVLLKKKINQVLSIPPGYVNGLKALEDNSEILIFSDRYLKESGDDQIKFEKDLWFDWNQF
ncbi:MAG: WxcM-like domain-containing protein [Bacteroidales bacterium]|nr:WxcM-like domain-containing protein [Bacteroidales bacterium]